MTNNLITLTIPNDDHVALRAFGKALEEMALAHGAESVQRGICVNRVTVHKAEDYAIPAEQIDTLLKAGKEVVEKDIAELDTTTQQVESLTPFKVGDVTLHVDEESGDLEPVSDKTGTPWDERIHSTSKALNADATWRLRRKPKDMDEAEWATLIESVKNELMGVDAEDLKEFEESKQAIIEPTREEVDELIEASNEMLATIEPPVTPPGDDFHTDAGVVTEQTVAGIPPIPVPPPVVVPPAPVYDFPGLMKFLTERHGKIDVPTVNQLLAVDGLTALTDLNAHPDKIGPFVARVKAHLGE